ncbi:MAG: GNAT family N-acetyltransferase [Alkalispirochaetaceae bacterium]
MSWRLADLRQAEAVRTFVAAREPAAVVFSEYLKTTGVGKRLGRYQRVLIRQEGRRITGAVLQTGAGFFVPAGLDDSLDEQQELRSLLAPEENRVHSVMGELDAVDRLTRTIALPVRQWVDYHLMFRSLDQQIRFVELPLPGMEYHWATLKDARGLREIQEAYEREEVILPGHYFDPRVSLENLKYQLKSQLVLYATHEGRIVAKAATNARGFLCDQLGGVYTDPEYRRRGVARWLVSILIRRLKREGRSSSLFVKPDNRAAVELYRELGFSIVGPFRISYY